MRPCAQCPNVLGMERDLQQIDGTIYYTLGTRKDAAGPAMVNIDSQNIRLGRDFQPLEPTP